MLSALLKEHQSKASARKETQDRLRNEAHTASKALTDALVDHLNVGVAQAYLNQKRLDYEAKELHRNATDFSKRAQNWITLIKDFNERLKDLGDVQSWCKTIEDDMKVISTSLEYVYKVNKDAASSDQANIEKN